METNLTLITKRAKVDLSKLASQVYTTLRQNESLVAEVEFVSEKRIRTLNRDFRNIDKVTDVLSFPTLDGIRGQVVSKKNFPLDITDDGKIFIGRIAVCIKQAKRQAEEYGHSLEREYTYLVCHGLLHLMGYDHMIESDKIEMRKLEEEIMTKIKVTR
jgi:probable rRNA maturation factor